MINAKISDIKILFMDPLIIQNIGQGKIVRRTRNLLYRDDALDVNIRIMSLPILYSFRRCPYAMRARAALVASAVPVEMREIELRNKPPALFDASPKGSVPVLVLQDGQVIDESWDIMLWALRQNDPLAWLGSNEEHITGTLPFLIANDTTFKRNLDCYKYPDRFPEQPQSAYRAAAEQFMQQLEIRLNGNPCLLGTNFTLADAVLSPFVRQFAAVEPEWFATAPYPALRRWLEKYTESELFSLVMKKFPVWQSGETPVIFGY